MVGCVIVRQGKIVGEGFHRKFGGAHAEIEALRHAGILAQGADLYVNLEPCSHYGKTPPCTDAIIRAGIKRVYVAMKDPNPLVGGKGIRTLRRAGIEVHVGLLSYEAARFNEKFVWYMKTGEPFVALKVAQTLDGYVADSKGRSQWITSLDSRKEAHRLRREYDAILIGAGTVQKDNPQLTVRYVKGRTPIRIVLDGHLRSDPRARVFDVSEARTLLLTSSPALKRQSLRASVLARQGVEVYGIGKDESLSVSHVLKVIGGLNISSVLVEGGPTTAGMFLSAGKTNALYLFLAGKILGGGLKSFLLPSLRPINRPLKIKTIGIQQLGPDLLLEGRFQPNHL
jgi:diaminohydroxyphosphoribosylaminopyrimidine deaminase/5-amino-6-(5-phosphoribosylamino)uracil reductase